eukprot:706817_1
MSIISYSQDASRNPYTITRYILQQQKRYPKAKGDLTIILSSVALSIKIISAAAKGAGIFQRYGINRLKEEALTSLPNASSDMEQMKQMITHIKPSSEIIIEDEEKKESDEFEIRDVHGIREFAYDSIISSIAWCGKIPLMLSTLDTTKAIRINKCQEPKYILCFDPIDGKQNIQINASIGTIFGIYKCAQNAIKTKDFKSDCLQSGNQLIAAGYALYGDATVLMLSFGDEVNGFTLDPTIGEFVLTHRNVRCPEVAPYYSINEGYAEEWSDAVKEYVGQCKKPDTGNKKKSRYIGCMVADVHRCLIRGGIYLYPPTKKNPNGKLNLQCECNPLAFIVKAAGGEASNGKMDILDIEPKSISETTPIYIGSKRDVMAVQDAYKRNKI